MAQPTLRDSRSSRTLLTEWVPHLHVHSRLPPCFSFFRLVLLKWLLLNMAWEWPPSPNDSVPASWSPGRQVVWSGHVAGKRGTGQGIGCQSLVLPAARPGTQLPTSGLARQQASFSFHVPVMTLPPSPPANFSSLKKAERNRSHWKWSTGLLGASSLH